MTRWVRVADVLFFATLFCVTFENVHWNVAGRVSLADVLAILFLGAYVLALRDRIVPQTVVTVAVFALALLTVYLIGFFNLETTQAFNQFFKGLVKFGIHFAFLAAGVHYVARRSVEFYWRTLTWFVAGVAFNGLYGLVQFARPDWLQDDDGPPPRRVGTSTPCSCTRSRAAPAGSTSSAQSVRRTSTARPA